MNKLKVLIEKIVNEQFNTLLEAGEIEVPEADMGTEEPAADTDMGEGDDLGGGLEDLSGDFDAEGGAEGAEGLEGEDGAEGEDTEGLDDFGGFGGGGGGGGGGGFGSGGLSFGDDDSEDSGDSDSSEEENTEQADIMANLSEDPVQAVVQAAKEMRKRTGDSQQILNSVKAGIQERFANFDDAAAVIEMLWDTQEPVLQVVARKLILFIKGN